MERLEVAMNSYWGERCADYDATCSSCKAWRDFDEALGRWQPIETAPKDGTWIMTVVDGYIPDVVHWRDGAWIPDENYDQDSFTYRPTHWMPLPPPPPT